MLNVCGFMSMLLVVTVAQTYKPLQTLRRQVREDVTDVTVETNYRLPTNVLPSYYNIRLAPNLGPDEFSFAGESSIKIDVLEENKTTIRLHAKNLHIDEKYTTLLDDLYNKTLKPVAHSIDNETDFLNIRFEDPVTVGSYWLNLKYTGQLNNHSAGLFKTSYDDENGKKIWLVATFFESALARQAFPCFDEPAMKAKFQFSIKHPKNYTAISNMPVKSETTDEINSQMIWTNFDVTPIMSTYLTAFIVSDLKKISSADGKFSCWTERNRILDCSYALEIIPKAVKILEDYMGSTYGIPKIDNIAIPSFQDMAMENWGLITYSDERLLNRVDVTSIEKQKIVKTICHELSHGWFGNKVTPEWWEHVWLSEGFAAYFEYFIADKVDPSSRFLDLMVIGILQGKVFETGTYEWLPPMITKVNRTSDIRSMFDHRAYQTDPCFVRMVSHVLTERVFHNGLKQYVKNNEFGAATTNDLLIAFATAANDSGLNIPLKEFFDTWTLQAGYPVINVNRLVDRPGYVSINQTRFLRNISAQTPSKELWWIPINFATQKDLNFDDTQPSEWVTPSIFSQEVPLELDSSEWFIVNKQQTGYYRVNYDEKNWALIADYLDSPNYSNIHVLNRAQLLDDSFQFASYEYFNDHSVFLNISRYLAREVDYIPWNRAFHAIDELDVGLWKTETYERFKSYVLKLMRKMESEVGYREMSDDNPVTKLQRVDVIQWACKMGSRRCANETRAILDENLQGLIRIPTNLLEVTLCAALRTAPMWTWEATFNRHFPAKDTAGSFSILSALGCSLDANIINNYLTKLNDTNFRTQMFEVSVPYFLLLVASSSEAGFDITLDFMTKNVETMSETVIEWLNSEEIVWALGTAKATDVQIEKLIALIHRMPTVPQKRAKLIKKAGDFYNSKSKNWSRKYQQQIQSFLLSQN